MVCGVVMIVNILIFIVGAVAGSQAVDPTFAVAELIDRVVPDHSDQFSLSIIPQQQGKDVMQLASTGNSVVLRGSSGIALASAFNWYLNEYCNNTYDWNTYTILLPSGQLPLPPASGTPIKQRQSKYSYYMNVCTHGYSLAFVSWDYWVKHIGI